MRAKLHILSFLCPCMQSLEWTGLMGSYHSSLITMAKSGNAFQLVYLKSIYMAVISGSLTYWYLGLILKYKYSCSKLEYNLGHKKLTHPVYQIALVLY